MVTVTVRGNDPMYKPQWCTASLLIRYSPCNSYMGNCQNYGPFLGPYYNTGPNAGPNLGDPKRDHNFDNPPHLERVPALPIFRRSIARLWLKI